MTPEESKQARKAITVLADMEREVRRDVYLAIALFIGLPCAFGLTVLGIRHQTLQTQVRVLGERLAKVEAAMKERG